MITVEKISQIVSGSHSKDEAIERIESSNIDLRSLDRAELIYLIGLVKAL